MKTECEFCKGSGETWNGGTCRECAGAGELEDGHEYDERTEAERREDALTERGEMRREERGVK